MIVFPARRRYTTAANLVILVVALFTITVSEARGQDVTDVMFLPQTYHVGDRVEARVVLRNLEVDDLTIPAQPPETSWVRFESIIPIQRADGVELRILFQPFFVGTRELPALDLDGAVVTGITAFTTSVRTSDDEAASLIVRDQLVLPGTQLQLALLIGLIVIVPIVVIVTGGWGRRTVRRVARWYRENRPYRTFSRAIKALNKETHAIDGKTFYIRLLDISRTYLDGRFGTTVRSATTGELDGVLSRAGIDDESRRRIVSLFQFGDLVKFANQKVGIEARSRHVQELQRVVETLQREGVRDVDS